MATIDPPYRLDPLQNPVNVKWEQATSATGSVEGRAGVSIGTVWFTAPTGQSGVGFPSGEGTLVTLNGANLHGVWSGGGGGGSDFPNNGDGPFTPIGGGGTAGGFSVENGAGTNIGGAGSYNFGGLTFVQNGNGREFTVAGAATAPFTDMSEAAGVPRFITVRWTLRMVYQP